MPRYSIIRRLLAVASFFAVLGVGKACQPPQTCTIIEEGPNGPFETTTTTAKDARCAEAHDLLNELRRRDPGGNIDLGRN